jgi:general secretion pathway protein G
VLAAMGLLLALALPRYVAHVDQARETALKHDLRVLRDAIDVFHAEQMRYPASLSELVSRRYLRAVPRDPITEQADSWRVIKATDGQGVHDVFSGAPGRSTDGSSYAQW